MGVRTGRITYPIYRLYEGNKEYKERKEERGRRSLYIYTYESHPDP
jgi:hypothetical protein